MKPAPHNPPTDGDLLSEPWALFDAREVYTKFAAVFEDTSFILAMHGSCLREDQGNDLDLLAVQWRFTNAAGSSEARVGFIIQRFMESMALELVTRDQITNRRANVKFYLHTANQVRIIDLLIVLL